DYHHQVYAFFGQDDWRVTPKLTLNLGLRYELFTTIKERHNEQGTFDLATASLIVPKGVNAQLTPMLAAIVPVRATGTPGLIPSSLHFFSHSIPTWSRPTFNNGTCPPNMNCLRTRYSKSPMRDQEG